MSKKNLDVINVSYLSRRLAICLCLNFRVFSALVCLHVILTKECAICTHDLLAISLMVHICICIF